MKINLHRHDFKQIVTFGLNLVSHREVSKWARDSFTDRLNAVEMKSIWLHHDVLHWSSIYIHVVPMSNFSVNILQFGT